MKKYLQSNLSWQAEGNADLFDEVSLWSAPAGIFLLEQIPLQTGMVILDIGCGTGFPVLELAQRCGETCRVIGVDIWQAAIERARKKISHFELANVEIITADAAKLPLEDSSVDLVTSNLGINYFADPMATLKECYRVLKPFSRLAITSNVKGTFSEFFRIFEDTLRELNLEKYKTDLTKLVNRRHTLKSLSKMLVDSGFRMAKSMDEHTKMRFTNGSAFLNHSTIVSGFLHRWKNIFPDDETRDSFFDQLEKNLNHYSDLRGEILMDIPLVYLEAEK